MPVPLWQNPYAQSISELMQAGPKAQAQGLISVAEAQARARELNAQAQARAMEITAQANAQAQIGSGQAWAGAAQNIGQIAAGLPLQIAGAQRADLQNQMLRRENENQKQQTSAQQAYDAIVQGDTLPAGAQGPRQQNILDENGLLDVSKIRQRMSEIGFGSRADAFVKTAEMTNDSIVKHQEAQAHAAQRQAVVIGDMAHGALQMMDVGVPPLEAMDTAASAGLASKVFSAQDYSQIRAKIASLPPEQQQAALENFRDYAARLSPDESLAKDAQKIDRYGRVKASNAQPDKLKTAVELAADAANPASPTAKQSADALGRIQAPAMANAKRAEAAQAETARHNAEMEKIQRMSVGRAEATQAETARHNKAVENPLGTGPGAATTSATGADLLATLPPGMANEVKAYAEGKRPFPSGAALRTPYFQKMLELVGQYDPSFDAVNYNARSKTRNDFTSGASSKTINALNTVAQHLDRLSDAAEGLNNSWLPAYNSVANMLSRGTGNPSVVKFETDKKAVVDELTRAWRQAGGTEADIKTWSSVLDASSSPAQLHTAIGEMSQLLEGKLSALESQYKQGMGTAADLNIITPGARSVLEKLKQKASGTVIQEYVRDAKGNLVKKGGE